MHDYMPRGRSGPSRGAADQAESVPGKRTLTELLPAAVPTFVTPGVKVEAKPPKPGALEDTMGVAPHPQTRTEHGDIDGALTHDTCPYAFVFGGRTGAAPGWILGGNGGHGNQFCGSAITVAPIYDSDVHQGQGRAWVRAGTGLVIVPRSYTGITGGAMPNGWYVTPSAVGRIDQHEMMHVNTSQMLHNVHIVPLEGRIVARTGQANALVHGATAPQAVVALQAQVAWNGAITLFYNADIAMNIPWGGVDMMDVMSGTYPLDLGPRMIFGTQYAHVFGIPNDPFIQALDDMNKTTSTGGGDKGGGGGDKGGGKGGGRNPSGTDLTEVAMEVS